MGREFLPTAENLVDDLSTAVDSLRDLAELRCGKVTVAALPSVAAKLLPDIILTYRRRHPDVQIRLLDLNTEHIHEAVRNGSADFGLGYGSTGDKVLKFDLLFEDEIVVITPPDHAFARRRQIAWRDLQDQDVISYSDETSIRRLIDAKLAARGLEHRPMLEPTMTLTMTELVRAGVGLGILLSSLVDSPFMRGLAVIPIVEPVVRRPIGIVTRANRVLTPAAEAMRDLVVRQVPAAQPG